MIMLLTLGEAQDKEAYFLLSVITKQLGLGKL